MLVDYGHHGYGDTIRAHSRNRYSTPIVKIDEELARWEANVSPTGDRVRGEAEGKTLKPAKKKQKLRIRDRGKELAPVAEVVSERILSGEDE